MGNNTSTDWHSGTVSQNLDDDAIVQSAILTVPDEIKPRGNNKL